MVLSYLLLGKKANLLLQAFQVKITRHVEELLSHVNVNLTVYVS